MDQKLTNLSWDIFCRVVDNYGDIGICWRLARQLVNEYPFRLRLWVDELAALKMIWPSTELIPQQVLEGIEVCQWIKEFPNDIQPADIVIEAFACNIPSIYLQSMQMAKNAGRAPIWINLNYLSAEKWVEDCHKMQSIHPQTGLKKIFFFPGFTEKTGGLIREKNLQHLHTRPRFSNTTSLANPPYDYSPLLVSLFTYENAAVKSLIDAWINGNRQIHCLIPQGRILNSINPLLTKSLAIGEPQIKGSLTLELIPFMNQLEYDQLLRKCDLNFVRGEDSLIRAIWAGKPFVWHIYQQQEDTHMIKLQTFLDNYTQHFPEDLRKKLSDFWIDWNRQDLMVKSWTKLDLDQWTRYNYQWVSIKQTEKDLASRLIESIN